MSSSENDKLEAAQLESSKATELRVSEEARQERAAAAMDRVEAALEVELKNGNLTDAEFWAQLDKAAQEIDDQEENFYSIVQLKKAEQTANQQFGKLLMLKAAKQAAW